jgi:hypothetical protein
MMSAKFDHSSWLGGSDNPMSKGNMTVPGTDNTSTSPTPEEWVQVRGPEIAQRFNIHASGVSCPH